MIIVDIKSITGISKDDLEVLYICMPRHTRDYSYVRENFNAPGATMFYAPYTLANMYFTWGDRTTIAKYIDIEPLIKYRIYKHRCLLISSVTEQIYYKYFTKITKKRENIIPLLHNNIDFSCDRAIDFLVKKNAFSARNWHRDEALEKYLRILACIRYKILSNRYKKGAGDDELIVIVDTLGYRAHTMRCRRDICGKVKPIIEVKSILLNRAIDFTTIAFANKSYIKYSLKDTKGRVYEDIS